MDSEKPYNAEESIFEKCEKHKIFFTKNKTEYEGLKIAGLLNLVDLSLSEFISNKKANGYYILEIKDPETKAKYPLQITYEGGEEPEKEVNNKIEQPSQEILDILMNPNLLEEIDKELDKKIVGENESRKTIFMVANMRNVENLGKATDNLMVNAPSGTGKDHLCEAIFELIPDEEKEELIRTTPKVLAYTRNRKLKFSLREDLE